MSSSNKFYSIKPALLLLIIIVTFISCEKSITQVEPDADDGVIQVIFANNINSTDEGIIVDGRFVYRNTFRQDSALSISDYMGYIYHRPYSVESYTGPKSNTGWSGRSIQSFAAFNKAPKMNPSDPDFKYVFDYLDVGDLVMNNMTMVSDSTFETPIVGGNPNPPDSLFEVIDYRIYFDFIYSMGIDSLGDRDPHEITTPLKTVYDQNGVFTLTGTNSPDVEEFTRNFTFRKAPKISSIQNGSEIDFEREMPIITAQNDLTITFDRVVEAGSAFLSFFPFPTDTSSIIRYDDDKRKKLLYVSFLEDTDEATISSDILQELRSNSDIDSEFYRITFHSYNPSEDVLTFDTLPGSDNELDSYTFPIVTEGSTVLHIQFKE